MKITIEFDVTHGDSIELSYAEFAWEISAACRAFSEDHTSVLATIVAAELWPDDFDYYCMSGDYKARNRFVTFIGRQLASLASDYDDPEFDKRFEEQTTLSHSGGNTTSESPGK